MTQTARQTAPPQALEARWRRLARPLAGAGLVAASTAYVWAVDPTQPGHYPLCPTFALTGIYCPGCGMLRATHALLHGDLAGSVGYNPLLVPLTVLALIGFGLLLRARWRGVTLGWDPPRWLPWALVAGFVLFTLARNVPGWTWLSPA